MALFSLLADPIEVDLPDDDSRGELANGQHRVQPMIDQGVPSTVIANYDD